MTQKVNRVSNAGEHFFCKGNTELDPAVSVLHHVEQLGLQASPVQLIQLVVTLDHARKSERKQWVTLYSLSLSPYC